MEKYVQKQRSPKNLVCKYLLEEISAHCVASTKHKGKTDVIESCTQDQNLLTWIVLISTEKNVCSCLETRRLHGSTKSKLRFPSHVQETALVSAALMEESKGHKLQEKLGCKNSSDQSLYRNKTYDMLLRHFCFSVCGKALCVGISSSTVCDRQPYPSSYLRLGFGL